MRTTPPFRADHVGSLLRPQAVIQAREQEAQGKITKTQLRSIEDDAIRDAVRMQEELGLESATDGEIRRGSWHMDFLYRVGGVQKAEDKLKAQFRNAQGKIEFTPAALRVAAKLYFDQCIFEEDFLFLKSACKTATPKLTIPAPSMMHYRGGRAAVDPRIYPDLYEFWDDLAKVYGQQVAALGNLGCTYLQLDDTSLAYLNDPQQRAYISQGGSDGAKHHFTLVRVVNELLKSKPPGMTVTTHLCRGNFRSSWVAEGGYDYVAEAVFGGLNVDGFFLEFDDDRSGGFAPLRFVPKGKMVVLGLVTSKRPDLESKDTLKRRIDEAAKYLPLDQLCLSPQCGFSSTVDGNALTEEQQMAKLQLVVETAREVWG